MSDFKQVGDGLDAVGYGQLTDGLRPAVRRLLNRERNLCHLGRLEMTRLLPLTLILVGHVVMHAAPIALPVGSGPSHDSAAAIGGIGTESLLVSGVCVDQTGRPEVGVKVTLQQRDAAAGDLAVQLVTVTDSEGAFQIDHMHSDVLSWVHFESDNFATLSMPVLPGFRLDDLSITLHPRAPIVGTVSDRDGRPVEGVRVWADLRGDRIDFKLGSAYCDTTDEAGTYAITDVGAFDSPEAVAKSINRTDTVAPDGSAVYIRRPSLRPIYAEHPEYSAGFRFLDSTPATLDFVLEKSDPISGFVRDLEGNPIADAVVVLREYHRPLPSEDTPRSRLESMAAWYRAAQKSNADGHFEFLPPPKGNYELKLVDAQPAIDRQAHWLGESLHRIDQHEGDTGGAYDLTASRGRLLKINIVDDRTGKPFPFTVDEVGSLTVSYFGGPDRPSVVVNQWKYLPDGSTELRLPHYAGKLSASLIHNDKTTEPHTYVMHSSQWPGHVPLEVTDEVQSVEVRMRAQE